MNAHAPENGHPPYKRRILYVIDSLRYGGAEILLLDLARHCKRRGDDVEVAFFTDGPLREQLTAHDIRSWRIGRTGLASPWPVVRLAARMRRLRPDVVHTHLRKSDLAGQLAARIAGVPVRIATIHNADPWRRKSLYRWIDARLTAGCQRRITVSPAVTDYVRRYAAFDRSTLVQIDNGVDTAKFDPGQAYAERRATWRLSSSALVVGIVGRLEPQKDHATFIAAAAKLAARYADARFVVVGEGSLRARLERAARETGYSDRFVFAGTERDMPAALAAMDVIAFSSQWEGLPVALLEAMAMAKPVVATDVGGVAHVLGDNGRLVPPGDPQALATAIAALIDDPQLARRLGQRARDVVCAGHSLERSHADTLAVYEDVAAETA